MVSEFFQTRTDYIILIPEKLSASQLREEAQSTAARMGLSHLIAGPQPPILVQMVVFR